MHRFLLFVITLFILSPTVQAQETPCDNQQCMLVVDAGSTGSRAHLYTYKIDTTQSPIEIKEIWSKKVKPGLASLEINQNTLDAYLVTLLSSAPTHKQIPVYFYATAGMRLLPSAKQQMIYHQLQQWFSHQSQWQLVDAKTITGSQEALYDWLSVNYHLGTLQDIQNQSVGVMDMGGASVQIVFPVQDANPIKNSNQLVEFNLYGQHLKLAVYSFLGLGQTEMSHQFLNSASCFANEYPLPDGALGQGDAPSCELEVSSLMNGVHKVDKTIQPLLASNPVSHWYSIGGISFLASNPIFHFDNEQLTNQHLLQQADTAICHQQWGSLNTQYPNDEYLYQLCLFSAYYYALMVDGYGLYPDETINYLSPDKNIDWTTGVVLHH